MEAGQDMDATEAKPTHRLCEHIEIDVVESEQVVHAERSPSRHSACAIGFLVYIQTAALYVNVKSHAKGTGIS